MRAVKTQIRAVARSQIKDVTDSLVSSGLINKARPPVRVVSRQTKVTAMTSALIGGGLKQTSRVMARTQPRFNNAQRARQNARQSPLFAMSELLSNVQRSVQRQSPRTRQNTRNEQSQRQVQRIAQATSMRDVLVSGSRTTRPTRPTTPRINEGRRYLFPTDILFNRRHNIPRQKTSKGTKGRNKGYRQEPSVTQVAFNLVSPKRRLSGNTGFELSF